MAREKKKNIIIVVVYQKEIGHPWLSLRKATFSKVILKD
jgi:hypothetical protein